MTYGGVDISGDCWGIDTSMAGALTDEQLVALYKAPMPNGQTARFLWGYAPLPGNAASKWDWTGARMRAAADVGFVVLMVQHCRSGAWVASAEQGAADGKCAAEYAAAQGYPPDCHLAVDDESLKNPGQDAIAHMTAWARCWPTPMLYEGFAPGMSAEQEYELPDVSAFWGAYGPWNVAKRGVRCRQGLQFTLAGIGVDPDHAAPDALGGVLRGMGRIGDANDEDPDPGETTGPQSLIPVPDFAHAPTDPPPAA